MQVLDTLASIVGEYVPALQAMQTLDTLAPTVFE
jgi:hypothetical protein